MPMSLVPRVLRAPSFLLAVAACAGTPDAPIRERDASGVEWVRNATPAWPDTSGWRLVETRTIALPDSGPGMQLTPTAALLGDDGLLYVAGREPMGVMVYDTAGVWRRTIGRRGEGPGEFRYIMLGLRHDTVLVQDPTLARLSRFAPGDAPAVITPSVCCMMGPLLPVHPDGRVSLPIPGGWRRGMIGGALDSVAPPDVAPDGKTTWTFMVPAGNGSQAYEATAEVPYAPSREATMTPAGLVVWGTTDRYRLIVSRTGRDTVRVIEAPGEAIPIPDSLRAAAYAAAKGGNGVRAYQAPMAGLVRESDIPTVRPLWSAVHGDAAGRLWVARPGPTRRVAGFDVFDSTGVLLGRVPSPHPRLADAAWFADRIVLLDETAEGRPLVRIFAIDTTRRR